MPGTPASVKPALFIVVILEKNTQTNSHPKCPHPVRRKIGIDHQEDAGDEGNQATLFFSVDEKSKSNRTEEER